MSNFPTPDSRAPVIASNTSPAAIAPITPISRERIAAARVLVVGDVMLDRYWFGDVNRISPEAPVPVVHVQRQEDRLGGAANVARNAAALGAQAGLLCVVGHDEPGECIVKQDEKGDCMYVLVEGSARVVHRRNGKDFELAVLKVGDFFGELALVDSGPRSADVETLTTCTMLRIEQGALRAIAGVYPNAAFKLLIALGRALVQRMRRGNQKYIDSLLMGTEREPGEL